MLPITQFHAAYFGREKLPAGISIARHRHREGYVTVIVAGGYHEAGLDGRRELDAGSVLVHRAYDAHLDYVGRGGADLINLPLPDDVALPVAFKIDDPDAIARLAENDPRAATESLRPVGAVTVASDWPDRLAADLVSRPEQRLCDWADRIGLAAETLSRGFRSAFGIAPARFRAEVRARRAMAMIERAELSLAAIAADCGYADQPHLNRAIVTLTGRSPGQWRRSSSFKSDGGVST
jgi:AraC-like DNA-binding protein